MSGGFTFRKFGDWARAGATLQGLQKNLTPAFVAQLRSDGEFVLQKIQGHIDNQDLGWAPLAERTVVLKGGSTTIYVETGTLRNSFKVRKVRSAANGVTFFIGADAWTGHSPSGESANQIQIWLEYGTDKMPARPLIRPTWEEVEPILREHWRELLKGLVDGGVR